VTPDDGLAAATLAPHAHATRDREVLPPLLELRDFTCRYPGAAEPALCAVDFAVHAGEIVAVMGASGAGKSTLLKCLTGIVPAVVRADVRGSARAFGRDLGHARPADLAGRVGLVFQDFEAQLFSTSCALEVGFAPQQLGLPRDEIRARTTRALERVGLAGFETRDPATLSGGEKQRLAIAGILALEPEVLLLDEPTTDIDPEGKRAILRLLTTLRDAGVAVVLVEHEILAAEVADRMVLLSLGTVVASGPSATLLRDTDTLARCGVRPRDLDVVARRLAIDHPLTSVDQAEALLRARGYAAGATSPGRADGQRSAAASDGDAAPADPLLEVVNVRFAYGDAAPALDGVSLALRDGEFVALIGPNGSGKTTLAKHLNGLLAAQHGNVRLGGRDLRTLRLGDVAREVGFVFQDPDHQLFCATVEEEVAYGPRHLALPPDEIATRVARALDVCGLADRRGMDPFLLRKGERQRLAVAAVLATEPRVLILDEPTTGLDHDEQRAVLALLDELHRGGRTIVVITHAPWLVAEHATRAVLMAHGRVLLDGDLTTLFRATRELAAASFVPPEATQLGLRFGVVVRSAGELAERLASGGTR
jgi:energy-coupling factor transport system ATP-binding protein